MKNRNKQLLRDLLSEALIVEQEEDDNDGGGSPKEGERIDGPTDNSLGQGRPPNNVTDTREMAADPSRAKELLKSLGASVSGSGWRDQVSSLFYTSRKHEDFGKLAIDVVEVTNNAGDKEGVAVKVESGSLSEDPKATYFFLRSLYTAAINSGALNLDSSDQKKIRLEQLSGEPRFIFYKGKAKSFNP